MTEAAIGGASFIRVDVPQIDKAPAYTKLFGAAAIYSITPVAEELARAAAATIMAEPVSVYIPFAKRIGAGPGQTCEHNLYNCEVCQQDDEENDDQ